MVEGFRLHGCKPFWGLQLHPHPFSQDRHVMPRMGWPDAKLITVRLLRLIYIDYRSPGIAERLGVQQNVALGA